MKKVSGATLVEWAAWAASTRFLSTGLRFGYDTAEVDASRSAVRDTFFGGAIFWVGTPPVRSDEVRGKQFSTHRPGYDKKEVDAFLEYAARRLAAMESTDRPAGPLVSGARLVGWATWAASTTFSSTGLRFGYDKREVDTFRSAVRDTFLGVSTPPVRSDEVGGKQFSTHRPGYDKTQVAAFLDAARIRLAAMESTDRPAGPLVSDAILARWAEWADSTTFRRGSGYTATGVDAFLRSIRDAFLGVSKPPVRSDEVRDKQFSLTDNEGPGIGYDTKEVDAFLEAAAWRLAAMESTDKPATDAASTPTDGSADAAAGGIPGWTPPPWSADAAAGGIPSWTPPSWSPDAADTRPFWRRIPTDWLIAGALVLVSAVAGWYLYASRSATGESEVAPAEPAQVLSGLPHDYKLRVVDLRVGDCFDLKDESADEIEDVKAVPCTTEHQFEVFYVGAMGEGSYPTDDAFDTYVTRNCNLAFGAYIGRAYDDSDLIIYWLAATDDAWRSGDRTVQCAAFHPGIAGLIHDSSGPVTDPLTRSLRGTRQ